MREQLNANPNFFDLILFTDESAFGKDGNFNTHNNHYYAVENPHVTKVSSHQQRFTINYWAGIINDTVVNFEFQFLY